MPRSGRRICAGGSGRRFGDVDAGSVLPELRAPEVPACPVGPVLGAHRAHSGRNGGSSGETKSVAEPDG